MLSPVIFWILLLIPPLMYPNDCDITAMCEHVVVQISQSLIFGLLVFGLPILLLGAGIVLVFTFLYGIYTFRRRNVETQNLKNTKLTLGALAGFILLYLLYIPVGPDECSRTITASQYATCLEEHLQGKTEAEVRFWLEERGYKTSINYPSRDWGTFGHENYNNLAVENYFEASRSFGRPKSLPYGTNFSRFVLPMFPAPDRFTIGIGIQESPAGVYYVHPDWSFEFL